MLIKNNKKSTSNILKFLLNSRVYIQKYLRSRQLSVSETFRNEWVDSSRHIKADVTALAQLLD